VLLAVRLYLREQLVSGVGELLSLFDALAARYGELKDLPMPGYTHLQPAMPSSVGMWLHAFAEWSSELVVDGLTTLDRVNTNPLGTASGFGVPVPLDRAFVAELLDLSRIQRSPIDAQNSRGRYELKFTRWAVDVASMVEKLSQDLQLFSMREFGFFALPTEMTTGSSIMPQKHNPDVLELLRASTAKIRAAESELQLVIAKLPSNYHRDFQLTKEPLVRAAETLAALLPVAREVVKRFSADGTRLAAAMTDDLYVTYDAFRRVRDGLPFRDAYRKTAERMGSGSIDFASLRGDFAIIAHDVERAFAELRSETEQRRSVAAEWSTRLQRIAECIWAG
jgi:argininosuccinate lyase